MPITQHTCSPTASANRGTASCYTTQQLRTLAARTKISLGQATKKKDIVALLDKVLGTDQTKWPVPERNDAFVPKCPITWGINNHEWLSNIDIESVMTQYTKRYPSFHFLGVHPIDFEKKHQGKCISMCTIPNLQKKRYGTIFNLDKHNQSGSHWVAVYTDTRPKATNYGVFYYDSTANPIPHEIEQWVRKIITKKNDPNFALHVNTERRQFKNTECGMFCMRFIIECIKGRAFREVVQDPVYDDEVHRLRKQYYRCPEISSSIM